ncbi:MAG TPA: hypothetical protein VG694_02865, partial [Candidatus Paceibacterota bacterium]|nr:hypothetical protein [Candidatus Paceibacterota bacterium]
MSPYPLKTKAENKEGGFIALTATIILTIVLVMLITANGTSSFFARFDALGSENKRVSLGLSEACSNAVLLKAVQDYNYNGGDTITMSDGSTCHVDSLHSTPNYDDSGAYEVSKDITIKTSVQYPEENGSWSTNQIAATIKNPDYSSTIVAPDCTLSLYDSDDNPLSSDDVINVGDEVKVSW